MKHPFWLVNSILLTILLIVFVFVFFSRPLIPEVLPLMINEYVQLPKKETPAVDLSIIYENDLFDTYKAPPIVPIEIPEIKRSIPPPPQPKPVVVPIAPPPQFREPLAITLVGIIVIDDDSNNIAMIKDKVGATSNVKVGDVIEDAQLIRIMKNKVIFIRSNGQQETLYISQKDAEFDQKLLKQDRWDQVIKKLNDYAYSIDPQELIIYIPSVGHFIDALNLTTVFNKGESMGCRVGHMASPSLGGALGLQPGDIIKTVDGISTRETASRFAIYQHITALQEGDSITMEVLRRQQPLTLTYILQSRASATMPFATSLEGISQSNQREVIKNTPELMDRIIQERDNYTSTVQEMHRQDKHNMIAYGPRNNRRNNILNSVKQEL